MRKAEYLQAMGFVILMWFEHSSQRSEKYRVKLESKNEAVPKNLE